MKLSAFYVFKVNGDNFKLIDIVFFESDMTTYDVKKSLVEHDGYPSNIWVHERGI